MKERIWICGMALIAVVLLLAGAWSIPGLRADAGAATKPSVAAATNPWDVASSRSVPAPARCRGYVALTFDDGPKLLSTELLGLLRARKVPAAFFYKGENARKYPDTVKAALAAGHQVGNHTWDHPDLRTLSGDQVSSQLTRTNDVLVPLAGKVTFFRPPFGSTNPAIRQAATNQNMVEALWTVDSKDYLATSSEQIVEKSEGMTDGGILLLHDGIELTLRALPRIIDHYHEEGLCFGQLAATGEMQAPVRSPELLFDAAAVAPRRAKP